MLAISVIEARGIPPPRGGADNLQLGREIISGRQYLGPIILFTHRTGRLAAWRRPARSTPNL